MNAFPNFIVIQAEDAGRALGCYGDPDARTPALDALAEQGCRYDQMISTAPVCAPSRGCLVSGRYPWSLGFHHMRSQLQEAPVTFTEYLRRAGYYVNWASKTDFNFQPRAEHADKMPEAEDAWLEELRNGAFPEDQPFFYYTNLCVTHESTMWGPAEDRGGGVNARIASEHELPPEQRASPEAVHVPPYLPDTLEIRVDIARFYEALAIMDRQAGRILQALKDTGVEKNTYVIYLSDHGRGLPREKRWLYNAGVHVSLLVKGPTSEAGKVEQNPVSMVDLAPTILSLAGVDVPDHFEGQVICGPAAAPPRTYAFTGRDRMDENFDRLRAVRSKRHHFIRNDFPQLPYAPRHTYLEKMGTMRVLRERHSQGLLAPEQALFMSRHKPPEELYDIEKDPHMVHNLTEQDAYHDILVEMRQALDAFQQKIPDMGQQPERKLVDAGVVVDKIEEYRQRLQPLPENYALEDFRHSVLEMPEKQ